MPDDQIDKVPVSGADYGSLVVCHEGAAVVPRRITPPLRQRPIALWLALGAVVAACTHPAPAASPADGVWQGSYKCDKLPSAQYIEPFSQSIIMKISNGKGRAGNVSLTESLIEITVSGDAVSVSRTYLRDRDNKGFQMLQGNVQPTSTLSGTVAGDWIIAKGWDNISQIRCDVSLNRK